MKRSHVNFIVDTVGLTALVLLTTTGWIMRFILPPGSGSARVIWNMDRHQWGYVHTWLAAIFFLAMVVHLVLHWDWVVRVVRGDEGERRPARGIIAVVALALVLLVGIASLVTPVRTVSGRPDHEEHEEHGDHVEQEDHEEHDGRRDGSGQGDGRGRGGGGSHTE